MTRVVDRIPCGLRPLVGGRSVVSFLAVWSQLFGNQAKGTCFLVPVRPSSVVKHSGFGGFVPNRSDLSGIFRNEIDGRWLA